MSPDTQKALQGSFPVNPLLIACARPFCDDLQRRRILEAAASCKNREGLCHEAEAHGLAPLVYHHLAQAEQAVPEAQWAKLRIQYLRHRRCNEIRMGALGEILESWEKAKIPVVVLKGGALCRLLYPEPALRPMSDLDLLVKPEDTERARKLLSDLGFRAPGRQGGRAWLHHHLPEARMEKSGITVTVEIHYDVFTKSHPASLPWDRIRGPLLPFEVDGSTTAWTLGYEEMLWHLCHHMITPGQPLRLISVADILGFAEAFVHRIDWERLFRDYPFVVNTLRLLAWLTPLRDDLRRKIAWENGDPPRDLGLDYKGWPHTPFPEACLQFGSLGRLLVDSLCPPHWWLRLHYGLDGSRSAKFCRLVVHPARLAKLGMYWLCSRVPTRGTR